MRTFGFGDLAFMGRAIPAGAPPGGFRADYRGNSGRVASGTVSGLAIGAADERDTCYIATSYSAATQTATPTATLGGQAGTRLQYGFDFGGGFQMVLFSFTGVTGTTADFVLNDTGTVAFQLAAAISARDVGSQNIVYAADDGDWATQRVLDQNLLSGDEVFAFGAGEAGAGLATTNMTETFLSTITGAATDRRVALWQHTAEATESPRSMRMTSSDSAQYFPIAISLRLRA